MVRRKRRAGLDVGEHARLQLLGERETRLPCGFSPPSPSSKNCRRLCSVKEFYGGLEGTVRRQYRKRSSKPGNIGELKSPEWCFLKSGVEVDVRGPARSRIRKLGGA